MVNFSYATPWLLHASLFSCKDDVTREHPHASFASAAFHASERHVRPMSGMSKRRTKSPPPSKEDGGLRHSRIDGFLNWRAARGFDDERAARARTTGAPQEAKRQALRKGRNRRAPCKGLNGRRAARRHTRPARWMRSARGETAGALQEFGRRVRCKGRNCGAPQGARQRMPIAFPAAQGTPESLVPAPPLGTYFPLRASSKMLSAMV